MTGIPGPGSQPSCLFRKLFSLSLSSMTSSSNPKPRQTRVSQIKIFSNPQLSTRSRPLSTQGTCADCPPPSVRGGQLSLGPQFGCRAWKRRGRMLRRAGERLIWRSRRVRGQRRPNSSWSREILSRKSPFTHHGTWGNATPRLRGGFPPPKGRLFHGRKVSGLPSSTLSLGSTQSGQAQPFSQAPPRRPSQRTRPSSASPGVQVSASSRQITIAAPTRACMCPACIGDAGRQDGLVVRAWLRG